jgi:hypothetical protein
MMAVFVFVVYVGLGAFFVEGCAAVGTIDGIIGVFYSAFYAVNHKFHWISFSGGFAHKIFGSVS